MSDQDAPKINPRSPFAHIDADKWGKAGEIANEAAEAVDEEAKDDDVSEATDTAGDQGDGQEGAEGGGDRAGEVAGDTEGEGDADQPDTGGEGEEDTSPRTVAYRYRGEDKVWDPFADESETARLLQLGLDHEAKAGIKDAIDKGIVRYDLENGGLVPGPAFAQAKGDAALAVIKEFEKAGYIEKDEINGKWGPTAALKQALAQPADNGTSDQKAELEKLREKGNEDGWTADTVDQYVTAIIANKFQDRDQTRSQAQAEQTDQEKLARGLIQADANVDARAEQLKNNFAGVDGNVDEKLLAREVAVAKRHLRTRDKDGNYQYQAAMTDLNEAADMHLQTTKAALALIKKGASPTKKPSSSVAAGQATKGDGGKAGEKTKINPESPFAHIREDVFAAQ